MSQRDGHGLPDGKISKACLSRTMVDTEEHTELSPPIHFKSMESPAVTAVGSVVNWIFDWARAATTNEAPIARVLAKSILFWKEDREGKL